MFKNFESVVATDIITHHCMNQFLRNGNADGYEADFIPRSEFALAVVPKAHDFYAYRHKKAVRGIAEEMIMDAYQKERYNTVYFKDIMRGVELDESFDEFKKLNPVAKDDKDYLAWRADKKCRIPREEGYIPFREKAKEIYEKSLRQRPVLVSTSTKNQGIER